jgi:hypothetical protein
MMGYTEFDIKNLINALDTASIELDNRELKDALDQTANLLDGLLEEGRI